MLSDFLENNIENKIHILSILHAKNCVALKEMMEELGLSASAINATVGELNFDLKGIAEIQKVSSTFQFILHLPDVTFMELSHVIYKNSNVLNCLHFLLTNNGNISFSVFIDNMFMTKSNAYRIKQTCTDYLHCIGLDIRKNQVIGDEYRIRFLIALLYYKYGIDCCGIDSYSIQLAREFILSTNQQITMRFLEHTTAEYGFFECLFILSWKRKQYPLDSSPSNALKRLKELFIYPEICQRIRTFLEPRLHLTFEESDFDYFHVIYCATNSCVLADKWSANDIAQVHALVSTDSRYLSLKSSFETYFGKTIAESKELRSVLIYFYKKCILDLQCIIPDKHYYLTQSSTRETLAVKHQILRVLDDWTTANHISYPIGNEHVSYLTTQLTAICKLSMTPVSVIVMSDLTAEIEVMKLYLSRNYSSRTINISTALINAQDLSFLSTVKNSVVIVKKTFAPLIATLGLPKSNRVVPVNIDINITDQRNILNAIIECDEIIFSTLWNTTV